MLLSRQDGAADTPASIPGQAADGVEPDSTGSVPWQRQRVWIGPLRVPGIRACAAGVSPHTPLRLQCLLDAAWPLQGYACAGTALVSPASLLALAASGAGLLSADGSGKARGAGLAAVVLPSRVCEPTGGAQLAITCHPDGRLAIGPAAGETPGLTAQLRDAPDEFPRARARRAEDGPRARPPATSAAAALLVSGMPAAAAPPAPSTFASGTCTPALHESLRPWAVVDGLLACSLAGPDGAITSAAALLSLPDSGVSTEVQGVCGGADAADLWIGRAWLRNVGTQHWDSMPPASLANSTYSVEWEMADSSGALLPGHVIGYDGERWAAADARSLASPRLFGGFPRPCRGKGSRRRQASAP